MLEQRPGIRARLGQRPGEPERLAHGGGRCVARHRTIAASPRAGPPPGPRADARGCGTSGCPSPAARVGWRHLWNPFEQVGLALAAAVDGAEHAIERLPSPQRLVMRRRQIAQAFVGGHLRDMARDRLPGGGPDRARVDHRGDGPLRPRRGLALDAVHRGDQPPERRLERRPRRRRPRQVVELRHGVRWIVRRASSHWWRGERGRRHDRRGGELRDRDVVRDARRRRRARTSRPPPDGCAGGVGRCRQSPRRARRGRAAGRDSRATSTSRTPSTAAAARSSASRIPARAAAPGCASLARQMAAVASRVAAGGG